MKGWRKKNPLIQTKLKTTTRRGMREYLKKYYRLKHNIDPSRYGKRGPKPKR